MMDTPLIGDGNGRYRVQIVGETLVRKENHNRMHSSFLPPSRPYLGVGKSTLAATLAPILGVPYIAADRVHWQPGWQGRSSEEFKVVMREVLDEADARGGWVIDGNYQSKLGLMVQESSTDIIWLDTPFLLYFPRLVYRTLLRILRLHEPCSPGCNESFREVLFTKKSIVWWCITHHRSMQRRCRREMQAMSIEREGGKMRRIGGWGSQLKAWLDSVKEMVKGR